MTLVVVLILSLFLTMVLTPAFMRLAAKVNAYDMPDERKIHYWPIPHVGGIAMAIGAFIPIFIYSPPSTMIKAYLLGALVVVIFGLIDDFRGMDFRIKFAGQIAASLIAVLYGGVKIIKVGSLLPADMVLANWLGISLTVFVIVGVINAINLADGLDGLAGGICLLIFLFIGYLAHLEQNMNIVIAAAALSGAILGFLRFNAFPAILFMGDAGSQLLGYSAAFLSITLTQGDTALSPLLPLIILGFPILDTLNIIRERVIQGRSPFSADKNHFHHRLMRMGLFHTESVFVIYVIQAFLIISAYTLRFYSEWLLLMGYLIFCGLILFAFQKANTTGWTLRRFAFIDRGVKIRLKIFRERGGFVMMTFIPIVIGAPLLLIWISLLPAEIPRYFAVSAIVAVVSFGVIWFLKPDWANNFLLLLIYLSIPFLVYFSEGRMVSWMNDTLLQLYNLSFLILAFLSFMTLRLTQRKKGFKMRPMDFLVLFVSLVLFALPDLREQFGTTAIKIILLFFIYEIVLGEVRGKIGLVAGLTVLAFTVAAVRGF